ncbi:MAG TPA: hypothetical protein VGG51_04175 [Candidatus Cybelea sp.]|jgi:hypothetical protein
MIAYDPEDIIEEQQNVEEIVEQIFTPSDYSTPYAMIAKKSLERARYLDENPELSKAVKKMLIGFGIFAQERGLKPSEIECDYKMTGDGRIVITLRRAW